MSETKVPAEAPAPTVEVKPEALIDRIIAVTEEVMKARLAEFEKKIDTKIDEILKSKEVEVEQALRKGFGLEKDPVLHMSDLIKFGRKSALEDADTAKKTPAPVEKATPEGNVSPNPIDNLLKEYGFGGSPQ